jgi:hypothetical protein
MRVISEGVSFSEKGPEQPANQGREHLWCKTHIHDLQVKTQAA